MVQVGANETLRLGNLGGAAALVRYRCGVLLAVNVEAQRIFPHLPHASVHEQALARAVAPPEGIFLP